MAVLCYMKFFCNSIELKQNYRPKQKLTSIIIIIIIIVMSIKWNISVLLLVLNKNKINFMWETSECLILSNISMSKEIPLFHFSIKYMKSPKNKNGRISYGESLLLDEMFLHNFDIQ